MRVTKLLITVVVICGLVGAVSAQRRRSLRLRRDVRVSKQHPTIYITFEGLGREQEVWLRLHNNTHWEVVVPAVAWYMGRDVVPYRLADEYRLAGRGKGGDAKLRYYVEDGDGTPVPTSQTDGPFSTPVSPGRSVLFSVSQEHLFRGRRIYLIFKYEWERGQGYEGAGDPIHQVEFKSKGLPANNR